MAQKPARRYTTGDKSDTDKKYADRNHDSDSKSAKQTEHGTHGAVPSVNTIPTAETQCPTEGRKFDTHNSKSMA